MTEMELSSLLALRAFTCRVRPVPVAGRANAGVVANSVRTRCAPGCELRHPPPTAKILGPEVARWLVKLPLLSMFGRGRFLAGDDQRYQSEHDGDRENANPNINGRMLHEILQSLECHFLLRCHVHLFNT
jgi:hypothetical protein